MDLGGKGSPWRSVWYHQPRIVARWAGATEQAFEQVRRGGGGEGQRGMLADRVSLYCHSSNAQASVRGMCVRLIRGGGGTGCSCWTTP